MKTKKALKTVARNQQWIFIILVAILFTILLIQGAQAQTIQMANPENIGQRDIVVYSPNVTSGQVELYGTYNTTSLITTDGNRSYIFTMKPQNSNPLDDPAAFLSTTLNFVITNVVPLTILVFLAALWLGRR
jgi:hypothetical protein